MPDVNVLVAALRQEHTHHAVARAWLESILASGEPLGLSTSVATGSVRLLTNRGLWPVPDTTESALDQIAAIRRNPSVTDLRPGPRHWEIFSDLCRAADARGNLVADAAHAALAIEHAATWVTFDRDFARFPGLRWEVPGR